MDKVKQVLSLIVEAFDSGQIPPAVAFAVLPAPKDIPSSKWSILNRTEMFLSGTYDARGMRQWNEQGRKINKGAKKSNATEKKAEATILSKDTYSKVIESEYNLKKEEAGLNYLSNRFTALRKISSLEIEIMRSQLGGS